ncbi:hypothetical protein [Clostridium sp. M14]|uniref:hypothetical protein n=1 Tax=Clostridium sp. M14 TaxID=2716311 RepID=UPI001CCE581A|nr:hypothetical protein [Clostridium sp. M14]MBZ9693261.1 hypothetical protein [Clostridium sp. M14]
MKLIEVLNSENNNKIFTCVKNEWKVRSDNGLLYYLNKNFDDRTQNWEKCTVSTVWINSEYKLFDSDDKEEIQEFQLGDTAYMIDEDYRFFESEIYKIELDNSKYYYTTGDCDFECRDIGTWVFKSKKYRELYLESLNS